MNPVLITATRCKYVRVSSTPASMLAKVAEINTEFILSGYRGVGMILIGCLLAERDVTWVGGIANRCIIQQIGIP